MAQDQALQRIKGSIVALVTPFNADGSLDEPALRDLVEWHIKSGTHGIVPCGTTGESPTLSHAEHHRVVEIVIDQVKKRIPVIAGAGSNSTRESVELTKHAKAAGADACLSITPYYNRPTEEGLYRHFSTLADAVDIPIILYNVPGRTGVNLLPKTVRRLAKHPNIVGIKEASGSVAQASEVLHETGKNFILLSGDDFIILPMLAIGGRGVISVSANVCPKQVAELCEAWWRGDRDRAQKIHYDLWDLTKALFIETNPVPVKTAVALMKGFEPVLRLPLCEMNEANFQVLEGVLKGQKLI